MLHDCDDVLNLDFIENDLLRRKSLERLSDFYCLDVLSILFRCLQQR